MLAEYGEDFADEHRFQVPEGCRWSVVRRASKNVGTTLANAMLGVAAANQKHLYGVFGEAQWTNKDRLPDELLKDVIEHFSALSLGNGRVASDVIGYAYEYRQTTALDVPLLESAAALREYQGSKPIRDLRIEAHLHKARHIELEDRWVY